MRTIRPWFTLIRHDEPAPPPVPPPVADSPAPQDPPAEPSDTDDPPEDDKGKAEPDLAAEVAKWKALARKHEGNAKTNAAAARKLTELEDAQRSEGEKLAAKAEAAEARAAAAVRRAVMAEIKVLAADADYADPTDAESAIKAEDFVDDKGEIDVDGIKAKLAEVLEAKPHWRKQSNPPPPKTPKPDPGQGSRGEGKPTDFRAAPREEFEAELAKYGVRPRR